MKVKKKFLLAIFLLLIFTNLYSETVTVSGTLKFQEANLGDMTLEFINSENKIFATKTDILGKFKIELEGTRYRIQVKDSGYFLTKLDDLIYDFSEKNKKVYTVNLQTEIKSSIISGRVIDENGNPIPFATIDIKSQDKKQSISATLEGDFRTEISSGFFTISVAASGYYDGAFANKVEKLSSITDMKLKLKRIYYNISGAVTDGISSVPNAKVDLFNAEGELLSETLSGENGYYEFTSFPSAKNYFLKTQGEGFEDFISEIIFLDNNMKNFNIILRKK